MKSAFLAGVSAGDVVVLDVRRRAGPNLPALYVLSTDSPHTRARTTEEMKQRVQTESEGGCGKMGGLTFLSWEPLSSAAYLYLLPLDSARSRRQGQQINLPSALVHLHSAVPATFSWC